jgi:hypothetical protein
VTTVRDARADIASDATAIIEQVIEDNIAREAVPNVACQMPLAVDYFPSTIGAIENERFSGLPVVLRKEASDLLGLAVLREFDPALFAAPGAAAVAAAALGAAAPVVVSPKQATMLGNLTRTKATPSTSPLPAAPVPAAAGAAAAAPACPFLPWPGNPGGSVATKRMSQCVPTQGNLTTELSCAAALTVRDAADGDDSLLPNDVERLASALVVQGLSTAGVAWAPAAAPWTNALAKLVDDLAQHQTDAVAATDFCGVLGGAKPPVANGNCVTDVQQALGLFTKQVNLATLDQALGLLGKVLTDGCSGAAPPLGAAWCASPAKAYLVAIASDSVAVVEDIRSKNYGAAASKIIDSTEQLACKSHPTAPECSAQAQKVYVFLETLAEYSVDTLEAGASTAAADSSFRQAAIALIEQEGGAGVHRSLIKDAAFLYVPEFALREAWRPGHIGPDGETLAYPSIDMLRWRLPLGRYAYIGAHDLFYLNLHGSFLDPLGPFVEVATRDPSLRQDAASVTAFGLGFVVPRLDLEFAVPQFSKNLVIGIGGALRFFRADGVPGAAHYCTVFDGTCADGKVLNWDNPELSAFVKYVP